MMVGYPPFYDKDPMGIYKKILHSVIKFPKFLSYQAKDLIRRLLNPDFKYRLGVSDDGLGIQKHDFFYGVDFDLLLRNKIPPPWIPDL